jgi:hypothetical protein
VNNAQILAARLSGVEKAKVLAAGPGGLYSVYHDFKPELSGGHLRGGTEAQGIAEMKQVIEIVDAEFKAKNAIPFGRAF